ncbi:MAG: AI-2E family transporter [bacterium]|nr:AI-2E family transporter [bacterium]
MNGSKTELRFLLVLLVGIGVLIYLIFKPFLVAIVIAVVFSTVFRPVYERLSVGLGGRNSLAAFFSTILVLLAVIVPLAFLGAQIVKEASSFYSLVTSGGATGLTNSLQNAVQGLVQYYPLPIEAFDVNKYVELALGWLIQHLGSIFANVARAIAGMFIFLIALYYLFKDGGKLKAALIGLSPLDNVHDERIFEKLDVAINSVVRGSLGVALIQGMLTAIGFAIFGVPNFVLWGSLASIASLIPGVGTALVILPAVIFLFVTGETFSAVGLLVWGATAVGLVDNFLGPKLVERGMQLHPFLILLSILGGLSFFGPVGFLIGPLVLSLFFAVLEIYSIVNKEHYIRE